MQKSAELHNSTVPCIATVQCHASHVQARHLTLEENSRNGHSGSPFPSQCDRSERATRVSSRFMLLQRFVVVGSQKPSATLMFDVDEPNPLLHQVPPEIMPSMIPRPSCHCRSHTVTLSHCLQAPFFSHSGVKQTPPPSLL